MDLSITTDYVTSLGSPEQYLRDIAAAGFTHIHWCHQWNTDFLYSRPEIDQIARWLDEVGLRLLDLHGSAGVEKCWYSRVEYERLAGVELVANRLEMTARLGGGVVIMHIPTAPEQPEEASIYWGVLRRSLDALAPVSRATGVRIAIENGGRGHMVTITRVLSEYDGDYVGLCYDCGHGNTAGEGLDYLERLKDRLISVHLHDNDGTADQHKPMFTGTVDWGRLARIMAASSYDKPVSQELSIRLSGLDEPGLLAQALRDGQRLTAMIAAHRGAPQNG
jgi:sugar phosphate isomerase/epimerase